MDDGEVCLDDLIIYPGVGVVVCWNLECVEICCGDLVFVDVGYECGRVGR